MTRLSIVALIAMCIAFCFCPCGIVADQRAIKVSELRSFTVEMSHQEVMFWMKGDSLAWHDAIMISQYGRVK